MEDIELVIKIPEEIYSRYMNYTENYVDFMFFGTEEKVVRAIRNGTPLPKGHGRLIDADRLKTHFIGTEQGTDLEVYLEPTIIDAPTIIEADKGE